MSALRLVPRGKPQSPLNPAEIARRAEAAAHFNEVLARARAGGVHQGEPVSTISEPDGASSETPAPEPRGEVVSDPPQPILPAPSAAGPPLRDVPESAADERLRRVTLDGAPVDRWVASPDGLRRWRPVIDDVTVTPIPGEGVMLGGSGMRPLRLDAELRRHFALLVVPEEWRAILEEAGALP